MSESGDDRLSVLRAAVALAIGAFTGALVLEIYVLIGALGQSVPSFEELFSGTAPVFVFGLLLWSIGLFVFAPVPWLVLHRFGWHSWGVALGLGAALAGLVTFAIINDWAPLWGGKPDERAFGEALRFAAVMALQGAIVGMAVWWVAYRWRR